MGFINLSNTAVGINSYELWMDWTVQTAAISEQDTVLRAVQEVARFQARIQHILFDPATLAAGETARFAVTVPIREAWLITDVQARHSDPGGSKSWELRIETPGPVPTLFPVRQNVVGSDVNVSLYPGVQLLPTAAASDKYARNQKLWAYGGDVIVARPEGTATGASTANVSMRVEIHPQVQSRDRLTGTTQVT